MDQGSSVRLPQIIAAALIVGRVLLIVVGLLLPRPAMTKDVEQMLFGQTLGIGAVIGPDVFGCRSYLSPYKSHQPSHLSSTVARRQAILRVVSQSLRTSAAPSYEVAPNVAVE